MNNFNNIIKNGEYHLINVQSMANKPPTKHNVGTLCVSKADGSNTKTQHFYTFNGTYVRHRADGLTNWGEWKHLPINETIPVPTKGGWGGSTVLAKSGCNCTMVGMISGGPGGGSIVLAKLEDGYRPILESTNIMIEFPPGMPEQPITVDIKTDGSVIARSVTDGASISLNGASYVAK